MTIAQRAAYIYRVEGLRELSLLPVFGEPGPFQVSPTVLAERKIEFSIVRAEWVPRTIWP
jgi:hypothetical protein